MVGYKVGQDYFTKEETEAWQSNWPLTIPSRFSLILLEVGFEQDSPQ